MSLMAENRICPPRARPPFSIISPKKLVYSSLEQGNPSRQGMIREDRMVLVTKGL